MLCCGGAGVGFLTEQLVLPEGVVGVLDGQWLPGWGFVVAACGVGGGEVVGEWAHGPAVSCDVVQQQEQYVLVVVEPEECGAEGEFSCQVEGVACVLAQVWFEVGFFGLDHWYVECRVGGREDDLVRAVALVGDEGAQGFVACDDVIERCGQGVVVEGAGQSQAAGHVVGGGGSFELVEEPQALLGVGQWDVFGALAGGEGGAGLVCPVQGGGEGGDGGGLEELSDGEFGVECGADAADEAGGEEGVSAEVEEVVVDGDVGDAQDVGVEVAEDFLTRGAWGAAGGVGGVVGCGQGFAVEFAVGGEREGVQGDEGRRHHVLRQLGRHMCAQRLRADRLLCHGVRDQVFVARSVLAEDDGGLGDGGVGGECGFDFAGFDAVAAEFDLVVGASGVFELAVVAPSGEVAGAVHAGAGCAVGVGGEAFGGQARTLVVAAGQLWSGDVELTEGPCRYRAQGGIEDVQAGVAYRAADGHGAGAVWDGVVVGDVDCGFCRPVEVVQVDSGQGAAEGVGGVAGQCFAAAEHPVQCLCACGGFRLGQEGLKH